jgi:hypothetical protein
MGFVKDVAEYLHMTEFMVGVLWGSCMMFFLLGFFCNWYS